MFEKRKNLAWLILARLIVVSLFLAAITYVNIKQPYFFPYEMLRGVTRLIIITYVFSILSLIILRYTSASILLLGYSQMLWDTMFVSILVIITGGISSTYAFFFNLIIISASFIFGRREAFYTAGFCGISYGLIIDLHFYGKLERFGLLSELGEISASSHVLSLIFTNLLAFFLTAILTGYLAERANKSENALKEIEIDYEELERLNSIIVSTLDSGLVTVNSEGKIRVFNRYASLLTEISQEKAYDLKLTAIFPEIDYSSISDINALRKEISYTCKNGSKKTLSVKATSLRDKDSNVLGAVIDFNDLTEIREMQIKLKKADRLAAIGELSARIAHEVRNPLASISGSVQLIAESTDIPERDKKLIGIILRETSRLDNMVREFLLYARPIPPVKNWFSLDLLIDDTVSILKGDSRFSHISINNLITDKIDIFADCDQFHQLLWNLILNSAEALTDEGEITIQARWIDSAANNVSEKLLNLIVRDNGSGISSDAMELIFEPFFTTKPGGSGLGLASVYRIIEAHNGTISIESSPGNGTSFSILLPCPKNTRAVDEAELLIGAIR